jgi:hypothetical protein
MCRKKRAKQRSTTTVTYERFAIRMECDRFDSALMTVPTHRRRRIGRVANEYLAIALARAQTGFRTKMARDATQSKQQSERVTMLVTMLCSIFFFLCD